MTVPGTIAPTTNDVLHSQNHARLTTADIAKAVARHKREHPNQVIAPHVPLAKPIPQKTTPRG
ncbi:MAG TPA: hypothetical protein VHZ25_04100 [Acidobacteriaceae bacterium]|jgi:hypothetical protein|nr:hypothetical protein [Acidobacteriaceae bacterium]